MYVIMYDINILNYIWDNKIITYEYFIIYA